VSFSSRKELIMLILLVLYVDGDPIHTIARSEHDHSIAPADWMEFTTFEEDAHITSIDELLVFPDKPDIHVMRVFHVDEGCDLHLAQL
jgi:hypothetical protein